MKRKQIAPQKIKLERETCGVQDYENIFHFRSASIGLTKLIQSDA